jgi:signal peptidase II
MRRIATASLTALFVFTLDRVAKLAAVKSLACGQSFAVIPGIFHLTLVFNKGAAFGILKEQGLFFALLSAAVIIFIILCLCRSKAGDILTLLASGMLLGGAAGNLTDRVAFGHVIDFLDFRIWPVFNIADSAITAGAVLLASVVILKRQ